MQKSRYLATFLTHHLRKLISFRWWKGLGLATKLPFARDRLVESYFWAMGVCFEPQYFLARKFFMKMSAFLSITDDIYDAYGTFEELELLTEAIERLIGFLHMDFITIISKLLV